MSSKNKEKILPDYLDVSSDEEKIIQKKNELIKDNDIERQYKNDNDSYESYKNNDNEYHHYYKQKYEDKYYHNREYRSRSRNRSRSRSRSRSRNLIHSRSRNRYKNRYENESRSRSGYRKDRYKDISKSRSNYKNRRKYEYNSKSRSRRSYRYKSRSRSNSSRYYHKYSRNGSRYRNKSRSKSRSRSRDNKNEYKRKEYEKNKIDSEKNDKKYKDDNYEIKKMEKHSQSKNVDKWTDGVVKEEFKSIKIEKYDKNKLKKINQNTSKEISQLKKDLNNDKIEKDEKSENNENIEKEKPNFEPSGILEKDLQNEYNKSMNNKIAINYKPPNDSIIPEDIWFVFKFIKDNKEANETYKLVGKDFFLIGKDNRICDIRIKQKNISRQHAVIQFRKIIKDNNDICILPYLIDLNSTNGTYLNGDKIDNSKYYELRDKDNLNFGDKKIDFVLMKMK